MFAIDLNKHTAYFFFYKRLPTRGVSLCFSQPNERGLLRGFRPGGDLLQRDTNKKNKKSKHIRTRVTASILSQRGFTITNRL